jgi:uncharacterized ion transporter superfamily protein YfcC
LLKKVPDVFVIVYLLIVLAAVLTWIVPGGSYKRREEVVNGTPREVVVQGSFSYAPANPQTLEVFTAPLEGFATRSAARIIVFIFLVGGAFYVLNETGAIAAGLNKLVKLLRGREYLSIPIIMTFFSFFGAVFGMCEEAMPFALILVPMALALGYDSLVGVSLSFLAAGVGFAGAFVNPFTLGIAQDIAGLPSMSGLKYRVLVWAVSTGVTIAWVMIYAARIKADPRRSPMYELDKVRREEIRSQQEKHTVFTVRHGLCLAILFICIVGMMVGAIKLGWFIIELGGLFLAMGIIVGLVSGMGPNALAKAFVAGCKDMAGAALIVGFVYGIIFILENGNIMDTVLYGMSSVTSSIPKLISAQAMYVLQMVLNFFIPSGSTKAALTIPIMAPLADLSGITRQTAVLAYQLGDGFTNMIIPTSGVTVGTLAMAKIPFERWARWNFPMQIMFFFMSLAFLVWPVLASWQ